ncbi:hypothetical protein CVT91_09520 [Candidatus Atribacteria bacterium HGW-Atribacteria-1]|nr:MAG: hypothetical protein CVT91_09520 [Candidatus Atribacteria bacterium HGW-Atribacteria-1]
MKECTVKDIAKIANVSPRTVSRVVNREEKVKRGIFSLLRTSPDSKEKIIALHNATDNMHKFCFTKNQYSLNKKEYFDIISERIINIEKISLTPYQIIWLKIY